jgi:hypothetical protein
LGLNAQSFQGGVRGIVTDPAGAAVPTVKVTLIDEATSEQRATVTNSAGEYTFTSVNPATYTVRAEAPAFQKFEEAHLVVAIQGFPTVDIKLVVGALTQTVNVDAEATLVETSNASTGQVIDKEKLDDLPNMGRNPFYETVKVSQEVTPAGDPKFNRMEDQSGSSQISINGGPVTGNNYTLDGIAITNSGNAAVIIPAIEAVSEVKVQISTYDAEIGRTGGGTFNLVLRSGTNTLHMAGFGYEWFNPLIANNYFANAAGIAEVPQMWKNYGASIGGPVVVPKIYNGKNKTFFWFAGEAYRQNQTSSQVNEVPTALEKTGNFSLSKYTNGTQQAIYDPLSTVLNANGIYTRTQFPGNIIPPSEISPIGLALASYYPAPTTAPAYYGQNDFAVTTPQYDRADQLDFKMDQQITSWMRGSVAYLHYGSREPGYATWDQTPDAIAGPSQTVLYRHVDATMANTTITVNPTTVISLRWGFNRYPNRNIADSHGFNLTSLGFPQSLINEFALNPSQDYFPAISMGDLTSYGGAGPNATHYYSTSWSGTVAKFIGKHSLKFGGDFRVINVAGVGSGPTNGAYSFSSGFTNAENASGTAILGTGAALASLLLGYPSAGSAVATDSFRNLEHYYAVFVQDDFRLNSKLTLNFGLRYEYETGVSSPNNSYNPGFCTTCANPLQTQVASGFAVPGVLEYAGQNGFGTTGGYTTPTKFGPRVGFAYMLTPKTTIRGGYGLFWAPFSFGLQSAFGYAATTNYVATLDGATPANSLSNPFPTGVLPPSGNALGELAGVGGQNITAPSDNSASTRVHQYSFDVQRELPWGIAVQGGFTGSLSHDLIQGTPSININQLPDQYFSLGSKLASKVANPFYGTAGGVVNLSASTTTLAQTLLPFPEFGTVSISGTNEGHALYYSFYTKAQKRLGHGLNMLSTVTWSRNENDSDSSSNTYQGNGAQQDYYNRAAEWGRATVDTPWRWTTAVNYILPFPKNHPLLNRVAGGWAVNFQTTMQTGFPLAITQTNLNSAEGTGGQRPNATGISPVVSGSLESRLGGVYGVSYINPAAFSLAPAYTFGNVSRTIPMRGPGLAQTDFSMNKTFNVYEKFNAQFRFEVFNLTNTPVFDGMSTTYGTATFGQITNQANYPRIVQLGLRFTY